MNFFKKWLVFAAFFSLAPTMAWAQTLTDVTAKTYEQPAITTALKNGWMATQSTSTFGYGISITPDDWLYMLMFLRTEDACPELGMQPTAYWTAATIRGCLSGAGVPIGVTGAHQIRRDEAMQQLFALRRRSFAFQQLETKPAGFIDPLDLNQAPTNRQGALIAADRLKLLFRTKNKILPSQPLLREDAALAVTRLIDWEKQGGTDRESNQTMTLSKEAQVNHWRDLDTDIYVITVKTGGDTILRPIIPRRSFNPANDPKKEVVRDEFVYQPVSELAKESGALAAINSSYFNVAWPWGAFEDTAIVNGTTILERTDRSTFIVCADGKLHIGKYDQKQLKAISCTPTQALGAGPLFLSGGEILTEHTTEGFDEYTQWERRVGKNARTAIGISQDRKTAYLIVVAGKSYPAFGRGGSSLGTFLKDKYPDISDAMMYDGGSSTALYADNTLLVGMGVGGGTQERAAISALGLFSKKAEVIAKKQFLVEQKKRWDKNPVTVKGVKPITPFPWQTVKTAQKNGSNVQLSGTRGSQIQIIDAHDGATNFHLTFDLFLNDATSSLILARREGHHEKGWNIVTELHVINPKEQSDTDIIKLFAYLPTNQKPDLKTVDVLTTRKSGIVFGDATGRSWFYYSKDKQLSPALFVAPLKAKTLTKKAAATKK